VVCGVGVLVDLVGWCVFVDLWFCDFEVFDDIVCVMYFGFEYDGGYVELVVVFVVSVFVVDLLFMDVELVSFLIFLMMVLNLFECVGLCVGEMVFVMGVLGGVGIVLL